MTSRLIAIWLGLSIGNVLIACFSGDWRLCWDRSFFQAMALLGVYISLWISGEV